jgi:hypothetical protein
MTIPRDPVILRREDYRRDMERMAEAERAVRRLTNDIAQLKRDNDNLRRRISVREDALEAAGNAIRQLDDALGLHILREYQEE